MVNMIEESRRIRDNNNNSNTNKNTNCINMSGKIAVSHEVKAPTYNVEN